jgi:hypothetical protein
VRASRDGSGDAGDAADAADGDREGEVDVSEEDIKEYQQAICYFREFLAKGHADLGRRGPICPFVYDALPSLSTNPS